MGELLAHSDWCTNATGRPEIYIESLLGSGAQEQVSANGGMEPMWAQNGEVFCRQDDQLNVVSVRLGESLEFDPPQRLLSFETTDSNTQARSYDVSADGQRILAVTTPDASRPRQIEIIPNWTTELERLFSE